MITLFVFGKSAHERIESRYALILTNTDGNAGFCVFYINPYSMDFLMDLLSVLAFWWISCVFLLFWLS